MLNQYVVTAKRIDRKFCCGKIMSSSSSKIISPNINSQKLLHAAILIFLSILESYKVLSFHFSSSTSSYSCANRRVHGTISMKWMFSKGPGSLQDTGGIGAQGELYFIPSKKATLKAPESAIGKEITIPIFPRNQVLSPLGEEYVGVYEMRYRQLINDVGDKGVFGHIFYSQSNSKLALVGTLSRIKKIERLEDGGIYVSMEGIGRFYLREIKAEKPYLRAKVQIFNDYCENENLIEKEEKQLLNDLRYSIKLMKVLYPQNNYTINEQVLKNRPLIEPESDIRYVSLPTSKSELVRRSHFSFAAMDMLKTDAVTKLLFLQEPVIEKRYATMLKVLEESTAFLEGEIRKRGVLSETGLADLREENESDLSDLVAAVPPSNWVPKNFVDGEWTMQPSLMD